MTFVVKVVSRGKDDRERQRDFLVEGTWDTIPPLVQDRLEQGERVIRISEGGYHK